MAANRHGLDRPLGNPVKHGRMDGQPYSHSAVASHSRTRGQRGETLGDGSVDTPREDPGGLLELTTHGYPRPGVFVAQFKHLEPQEAVETLVKWEGLHGVLTLLDRRGS